MPAIEFCVSASVDLVSVASFFTSEATTENPPRLASPRRLDGGVERQEIGLAGNRVDDPQNAAQAGHGFRQLLKFG